MGKGQMSKYESGKELPKLESLERLLRALGTSPLAFFYLMHVLSEEPTPDRMLPTPGDAAAFGPLFTSQEAIAFKRLHDDLLGFLCAAVVERTGSPPVRIDTRRA
jgi:transcriptional regulator with XRE-family HTH domain